jgi:hypothetical protein
LLYRVERDGAPRESFGEYRYLIYRDNTLVAHFWHDYRGDDNGIEFVHGAQEACPVEYPSRFLEGGGPEALALSQKAIAYLERKLVPAP